MAYTIPDTEPLQKNMSLHDEDEADRSQKWWKVPEINTFNYVFKTVQAIKDQQTYRRFQMIKYQRLYSNYEVMGFASTMFSRTTTENILNNRISLNVVKSVIDTITAKIAKNKPRPEFLTQKGDFSLQQKAKKLNQYLDGVFDDNDIYAKGQLICRDAAIFGTGAILVYTEDNKIKTERVRIDELIVDDTDGVDGSPYTLFREKWVARDALLEMFKDEPEKCAKIIEARSSIRGEQANSSTADQIVTIEAWHRISGPNAKDGVHTICIGNCTLFRESYNKDFFPIIPLHYNHKLWSYWGTGVCLNLEGLQIEINKVLRNIQLAIHLGCVPRVWVEQGANVAVSKINNEIGGIYKYQGQKPVIDPGVGMPAEVYQWVENLYNKAFQMEGVSQLSAQSEKPAGLNSGVALRTYQDVESERFAIFGQEYEQWYLKIAKVMIELTRDLVKTTKDVSIKTKSKKFIETIDFKDVNLKDDQFSMRMFPVSILPTTPEGKLQMIEDLIQAGFMTQEQAISQLDFPDLDEWFNLKTAALDNGKLMIFSILEEGKYIQPEALSDNNLLMQLALQSLERAKCNNVPEDRLDLLRTFINQCRSNLSSNQPQQPDQSQQTPVGQTASPPQSPLAPNGSGNITPASN